MLNLLDEKLEAPLSDTNREELAVALRLLNHHLTPDRETYIQRIKRNALAKAGKECIDSYYTIWIFSRLFLIRHLKDYERVERYKKEYDYLSKL